MLIHYSIVLFIFSLCFLAESRISISSTSLSTPRSTRFLFGHSTRASSSSASAGVQNSTKSGGNTPLTKAQLDKVFNDISSVTRKFFQDKRTEIETLIDNEHKNYDKVFDDALNTLLNDIRPLDKQKLLPFDQQKIRDAFSYMKQNINLRALTLKADLRNTLKESEKNIADFREREKLNIDSDLKNSPNSVGMNRMSKFLSGLNESFESSLGQTSNESKTLLVEENLRNLKSIQLQKATLLKDLSKVKDKPTRDLFSKKLETKFVEVEKKIDDERSKTIKLIETSFSRKDRKELSKPTNDSSSKHSDHKKVGPNSHNKTNASQSLNEYNYGLQYGDSLFNKTLNANPKPSEYLIGPIKVPNKFPFFKESFSSFNVDPFGSIIFSQPPIRKNNDTEDAHFYDFDYLAAYQSVYLCDVYHREIKDSQTLNQIGNEIKQVLPSSEYSVPTWAYISTFYKKDDYLRLSYKNSTYQVILATNGKYSFALLIFKSIVNRRQIAYTGYNRVNLDHFTVRHEDLFAADKLLSEYLLKNSNYDKPGKWIYRLDKKDEKLLSQLKSEFKDQVYEAKPLIKPPVIKKGPKIQ